MLKVEGHDNLVRDPQTGAIINNSSGLRIAKDIRRKILDKDNQLNELTAKVNRLESLLETIIKEKGL